MKYATVCSGIGAPEVAWRELWGPPVLTSEIEKFPSAVLKHHMPDVPNYGDMTKYKEWPDHELELICGGTPCQSFSIAGLRKGMDDPRGNLTLAFLGILARYNPRWFVFENVPGLFSSVCYGESDFGRFLSALAELGYSCAYRVLDAQYFGVPQRRRRVFVVGHLGADWRPPYAVLFEPESMRGNPPKGGKEREEVADDAGESTVGALCARDYKGVGSQYVDEGKCVVMAFGGNNTKGPIDKATACNAKGGSGRMDFESETFIIACHARQDPITSDKALPLDQKGNSQAIISGTLTSRYGSQSGQDLQNMDYGLIPSNTIVRRLTPMECERLQGFPDAYTAIPWRNKAADQCPDGPRYKALGNSMAVPVVKWIGQRIQLWEDLKG